MIQNAESNNLNGNAEVQDFKIEMNAMVFDMLVSKVYTDKVLAVIREWSTNAIDACIDAKLPIKFDVHLPTVLEPYFSVRDYGTGLSDEDVKGLYSTLGASTKRESNEYNGVFGIGRGAGLAYSTRFQVDSYFNGTKISYMVTTDNGIPAMISLGQTKTDEPNGLKIQVNVQSKDIQEFVNKAKDVYTFFDEKPSTNITINYDEPDILIDGDDWYIEDSKYGSRYDSVPLVIMGNVAYQIDRSHFKQGISEMLGSSIRFHVPLGKVSITPGREQLSFDKKTVAYLSERFEKTREEISEKLVSGLSKYKNTWDKMIAFNEAISVLPYHIRKTIRWIPKNTEHIMSLSSYQGNSLLLTFEDVLNNMSFISYIRGRNNGKNLTTNDSKITVSKRVHFMISDMGTGFADAAKSYRNTLNGADQVILIKMTKYNKDGVTDFIKEAKKFIKAIGSPDYVMASDYKTSKVNVVSTKGSKVITSVDFAPLIPYLGSYRADTITWSKNHMLSNYKVNKFYYVEMCGYEMVNLSHKTMKIYHNFFRLLEEQQGTVDFKVIGVPKGAMKNIVNDPRFTPIEKAASKLASNVHIVDFTDVEVLSNSFSAIAKDKLKTLTKKLKNKEVAKTIEIVAEFKEKHKDYSRYIDTNGMKELLKVKVTAPKISKPLKDIVKNYPLLEDIQHGLWRDEQSVDKVARYIELEDNFRTSNEQSK